MPLASNNNNKRSRAGASSSSSSSLTNLIDPESSHGNEPLVPVAHGPQVVVQVKRTRMIATKSTQITTHHDNNTTAFPLEPSLAAAAAAALTTTTAPTTLSRSFSLPLPRYLAETAFCDLFTKDGLLVTSRGMQGTVQLLAAMVRFYRDVDQGYISVVAGSHAPLLDDTRTTTTMTTTTTTTTTNTTATKRKPPLVVVLGLHDRERATLVSILEAWGTPPDMLPVMITTECGSNQDRAACYQQGGVFCITSRILIVDLLNGTVTANQIHGFLVAHAEHVTEQSTEAFILRIFHSQKQPYGSGFVKAVSEIPETLTDGFAKMDKILKALHVQALYLLPRFHDVVRQELEQQGHPSPPAVTEIHQSLSPHQQEMQLAIVAAVQSVLRELKSSTTLLEWNDPALAVENCVSAHFDHAISKQLEHDWHRLSPGIKQLVQDLRTLRELLNRLIRYDSVTFWKLIRSLKTVSAASRYPSMWLLTPAADVLYRKAKERVYQIEYPSTVAGSKTADIAATTDAPVNATNRPVGILRAILEQNPKWKLLQKVLIEIRQEHRNRQRTQSDKSMRSSQQQQQQRVRVDVHGNQFQLHRPTYVLVMVRDEKTVDTVREYLSTNGGQRLMMRRWLRYLEQSNDRSRSITDARGGTAVLSEEARLLLEEESRIRRILFGNNKHNNNNNKNQQPALNRKGTSQRQKQNESDHGTKISQATVAACRPSKKRVLNHIPDYVRQRRRVALEKSRGTAVYQSDDLERQAVLDEAVEATEHDMDQMNDNNDDDSKMESAIADSAAMTGDVCCNDKTDDDRSIRCRRESAIKSKIDNEDEGIFDVSWATSEMRVVIKSYGSVHGDEAALLLGDIRPQCVVLYDSEISFIRSVEVYASQQYSNPFPIRVFFLMLEASAEEKNFVKTLERERAAFEKLIHHKKTMPPPVLRVAATQEMQQAMTQGSGGVAGTYMNGTLPLAVDTRRGKGKARLGKDRRDIAVDVREFRSALPGILHQGGMRLAPVTLTVGDFVLSNVHCVERKSVGDLHQSFQSGRLYSQAEAMSKYYACPCLLIEFDPEKTFGLQSVSQLGVEIKLDTIGSKMVLLTMHFPKLRILWSRGPHETLRIFRELKSNHDEVDVEKAIEVGRNESEDSILQGNDDDEEVNEAAREMLLRLPGANIHSARKIMHSCDSLAELSSLSRDELRRLAGPSTGQKLFTFFRQCI